MMAAVFQNRIANRMFTMISYARSMMGSGTMVRKFFALMLLVGGLMWSPAAQAQNCAQATTQGTAPASWQTYCWLNLGNYNDTTARSTTGQNMTFTLPDGSVLSFNARVTGTAPAYNAVIAPSWRSGLHRKTKPIARLAASCRNLQRARMPIGWHRWCKTCWTKPASHC